MSNKPFIYQAPFPMGKDNTEYYLLTSDYVSVADFDGETILKVEPEALTLLAQQAFQSGSSSMAFTSAACRYSPTLLASK